MERDCLKKVKSKSPGPFNYFMPDYEYENVPADIGKKLPLSKQLNFLNVSKQTSFGTKEKTCVFGGNEKQYDTAFVLMNDKQNQGPGKYNIRNCRDPGASFHPKKITSYKSSFTESKRPLGAPKYNLGKPGPDKYYNEMCEKFVNKKTRVNSFGR